MDLILIFDKKRVRNFIKTSFTLSDRFCKINSKVIDKKFKFNFD